MAQTLEPLDDAGLDRIYAPPRLRPNDPTPVAGPMPRNVLGLTSIEWLVVAAIIALQIALLLPAAQSSRHRRRPARPAPAPPGVPGRVGSAWRALPRWDTIG